ncbi:MAG: hypothetical protein F4059_05660 [Gemmatimonadetes bacterium]|nr:hypothetical protein [Gemmatimonadota bacterium]
MRLTVPPTIPELLAQQKVHQSGARLPKVGAERYDAPVDAGLFLSLEERGVSVPRAPGHARMHQLDRVSSAIAFRIHAEITQVEEGVQVRPPERVRFSIAPLPVWALLIEQSSAPSFICHAATLGGDVIDIG